MRRDALVEQLILHEGLRLKPYMDSVGKITIGIGRNLSDTGITKAEALTLLDHDLDDAVADCASFPWFATLDPIRQRVVCDLRFNLGPARFRTFRRFLRALDEQDYWRAAKALQDSLWYQQVKTRGVRLVHMMRSGQDYLR